MINMCFCRSLVLTIASVLEQRFTPWILIRFFRFPISYKFLCADVGLPFLGHGDLALLEAIFFLCDWQESLLSMARNQKLAGTRQRLSNWIYFFNCCANFQIIFSYRASVSLKRFTVGNPHAVTALARSAVRGLSLPQTQARDHRTFLALYKSEPQPPDSFLFVPETLTLWLWFRLII